MSVGAAERAWQAASPWFVAIMEHPFVTGLRDRTLPTDAFERYLVDDAHYLERYARVLAHLAVRAEGVEDVELFETAASDAVAAERELHTHWMAARGVDPTAVEPTPTCRAYTGFLLEAAHGAPFDVAVAAVLPCFRIYAEVGRKVAVETTGDHPYAAWIATYADPGFAAAVRRVEDCLDRVIGDEAAAVDTYLTAARFEWMFWDAAWRAQGWPEPSVSAAWR